METASTGVDALIGQVLNDRYKVLEIIHRGSASIIYKAVHELMERTVAIKVLSPRMMTDITSIKRFQQEAQAASHLYHPGIVTVFDYNFTPDGQSYLVQEYVEGTTLSTIVERDGPLKLDRFRKIFFILCKAMAYSHDKGVIHRDLKPSHFLITSYKPDENWLKSNPPLPIEAGGELPVIVDFRLAKLLPSSGKSAVELTHPGEILGTPYYMSPEHCMAQKIDQRSDVYSMGCAMYFAFTGEPPFKGDSAIETMQMHLRTKLEPGRLPSEIEAIVLTAMAKKPEDRIQTMDALAQMIGGDRAMEATSIEQTLIDKHQERRHRNWWWPFGL